VTTVPDKNSDSSHDGNYDGMRQNNDCWTRVRTMTPHENNDGRVRIRIMTPPHQPSLLVFVRLNKRRIVTAVPGKNNESPRE